MSSSSSFVTGSGLQDVNRANVVDFGQAYKSNVNFSLTDQGAVAAGMDVAGLALNSMTSIGHELLQFVGRESENNRVFAGQAASKAIDTVTGVQDDVFRFLGQAGNKILDFVGTEAENNRIFAGQAVDAVRGAHEMAAAVQADAMLRMQQTTDQAFSFAGGAFESAIGSVSDYSVMALNGITGFVADVMKTSAEANAESVRMVGEATRSDASKSLDKVIMLAGVVMVAAMVMAGGGLKRAF